MSSPTTSQHAPPRQPDDDELVDILHRMIDGQVYSTRCFHLQRQGRMGTMAPIDGSEAIAAGAASALDPVADWIFPQYREQYALGRFGDELVDRIALYNVGHPEGGSYSEALRVFPFQISLATQIPHAVGMAWGMKVRGEPGCALTFFGDGVELGGRLLRGSEPRRHPASTGDLRTDQQRVGHLHPDRPPDRGGVVRGEGPCVRFPRCPGRRSRPARGPRGGARSEGPVRSAGRVRCSSRRSPCDTAPTPRPTTPAST